MTKLTFHFMCSLGSRVLLQMALRMTVVILIASAIGYIYVYRSVEQSTLETLKKYVRERGERESQPFLNVQNNLRIIANAYLDEINLPVPADTNQSFNRRFVLNPDGAWRLRQEGHDIHTQPSSFISSKTPLTLDAKRRVLATDRLTTTYGRAWRTQMATVYLASMDGLFSTYWPGIDWSKGMMATQNFAELPWVINANQRNNPSRSSAWTEIWYDKVAKDWHTSCILPIDIGGEFLHYAGGAISLNDILKRTATNQIEGTYNLIFRADGRLISHPDHIVKIKQSEGKYSLNDRGDPHLQALFQVATHRDQAGVYELKKFNEYLGVTRIGGPEWYFVTVFPKNLIATTAREAAQSFLWLGVFSLALELLILYLIIRKQITIPLLKFSANVARIRDGDLATQYEMKYGNELDDLAKSFHKMADAVQVNQRAMKTDNQALERCVIERTKELDERNAQIAKSLSLLHSTLDSTNDAILAVDLNNTWVLHNKKFVEMWQIPDDLAIGDRCAYIGEQQEDANEYMARVSEIYAKPEVNSFDIITLKDGKIIKRFSVPQRINGKVVGRVWSFRDITERKRVEHALHRAKEIAESALADQRQFVTMISHEYRSPLAVIDTSTQLLGIIFKEESKATPILARIRRGIFRLSDFLDNCLTTDRLNNKTMTLHSVPIDLYAFAVLMKENTLLMSESHRLVIELDPNMSLLNADPLLLRILLLNLLGNAIKYSPAESEIRFCIKHTDQACLFEITDQGAGIFPDELPFIFDMYMRGRAVTSIPGAGLGLALVSRIASLHGGSVEIISPAGEGVRATVTIPFNLIPDRNEKDRP